jgi:hypothetical protein
MKYCLNTGDELLKKCTHENCVHYDLRSNTGCLQHIYHRPLTALDIAHMESKTYLDAQRMQRSAEHKIAAWGKVLDKLDGMPPQPFIPFLDIVFEREELLAVNIFRNPFLCIVRPMRFIKAELWIPVLRMFHPLLADSGIATLQNKATWGFLKNYRLI